MGNLIPAGAPHPSIIVGKLKAPSPYKLRPFSEKNPRIPWGHTVHLPHQRRIPRLQISVLPASKPCKIEGPNKSKGLALSSLLRSTGFVSPLNPQVLVLPDPPGLLGGGGTRKKGSQWGLPGRAARGPRNLDGLAGAGAGAGSGGGGCEERQQQHQQKGAAAAGARPPHRVRRGVPLRAGRLSSGSGSARPRPPPPPEADSFSPQS